MLSVLEFTFALPWEKTEEFSDFSTPLEDSDGDEKDLSFLVPSLTSHKVKDDLGIELHVFFPCFSFVSFDVILWASFFDSSESTFLWVMLVRDVLTFTWDGNLVGLDSSAELELLEVVLSLSMAFLSPPSVTSPPCLPFFETVFKSNEAAFLLWILPCRDTLIPLVCFCWIADFPFKGLFNFFIWELVVDEKALVELIFSCDNKAPTSLPTTEDNFDLCLLLASFFGFGSFLATSLLSCEDTLSLLAFLLSIGISLSFCTLFFGKLLPFIFLSLTTCLFLSTCFFFGLSLKDYIKYQLRLIFMCHTISLRWGFHHFLTIPDFVTL